MLEEEIQKLKHLSNKELVSLKAAITREESQRSQNSLLKGYNVEIIKVRSLKKDIHKIMEKLRPNFQIDDGNSLYEDWNYDEDTFFELVAEHMEVRGFPKSIILECKGTFLHLAGKDVNDTHS